jgi:hypothetical protein
MPIQFDVASLTFMPASNCFKRDAIHLEGSNEEQFESEAQAKGQKELEEWIERDHVGATAYSVPREVKLQRQRSLRRHGDRSHLDV